MAAPPSARPKPTTAGQPPALHAAVPAADPAAPPKNMEPIRTVLSRARASGRSAKTMFWFATSAVCIAKSSRITPITRPGIEGQDPEHRPRSERESGARRDDRGRTIPVGKAACERPRHDADCTHNAEQARDFRAVAIGRPLKPKGQDSPEHDEGCEDQPLRSGRKTECREFTP